MLVLGRRMGQSVVIAEDIVVTVVGVRGNTVRLGIEAPQQLPVRRQEISELAKSETGVISPAGERRTGSEPLLLPATQDVAAIVTEEMAKLGGTVTLCRGDSRGLYLRAVLPMAHEVRPKDVVRSGVAVRMTGEEIHVHHYVFRQVCRNGAVMPVVDRARVVNRVDFAAPANAVEEVTCRLREAVRLCSGPEAFATATEQLRSAAESEADPGLHLFPGLSRIGLARRTRLRAEIVRRFQGGGDHSLFGLMNAVTSVARDESDPEIRWRLEELGGAVPSLVPLTARSGGTAVGFGQASYARRETDRV